MTVEAPESEIVEKWRVACDGGQDHPRVWLQLSGDKGIAQCGYCGKTFIHKDFAGTVK